MVRAAADPFTASWLRRRRGLGPAAGLLLAVALGACAGRADRPSAEPEEPGGAAPAREVVAAAGGDRSGAAVGDGGEERRPRVVFLGNSLTAGYGLAEEQAFPAVVGRLLEVSDEPIEVVNAGVSGDTTAGGLARLDWILRQRPDVVVVELGPNDGLRGLPLEMTEANLRAIVERSRAAGARVLLVGMQIPPNYGPDFAGAFRDLYPRLARELDVPLVPFLLDGVGGEPGLNLPDGLHPNAEGQRRAAENVLPHLRELLGALDDKI